MYIYILQFILFFLIYVFIDYILGEKVQGKYYLLHSINNTLIVYSTLPDLSVLEFNSDESITDLTVSGLEPGIIYKWRLVGYVRDEIFATPSRRLIGKTCIADLIEEEE